MKTLRAFFLRLMALFNRRRWEQDLADELESNLQFAIDDRVRSGMSPETARRDALLHYGLPDSIRESYRDRKSLPFIETAVGDIRYATRMLRQSRGFAVAAILSLALGIGANTAIFSLLNALILKSLPVERPDELVQVNMPGRSSIFTNPIWEALRDRQDVFSGVFAIGSSRFDLSRGGESRFVDGDWVSGAFFSTLGVKPVLGRTLAVSDDRRGCPALAVISYDFWQREFGGRSDVLEQPLSLDGHPFQILGVLSPGFYGIEVGRAPGVYTPLCAEVIVTGTGSSLDRRSHWWLRVFGRPRAGVLLQAAVARLQVVAPGIFRDTQPPNWRPEDLKEYVSRSFELQPASHGTSRFRDEYRTALYIMMAMVAVVLLIACANVANLLLARAANRAREMATRLALGSSRSRLVRQLLTECLLLSLAGSLLGALLAWSGAHAIMPLIAVDGRSPFLDLAIDARMLLFTMGVAVASTMLFGLAPAWRSSAVAPHTALKAGGRGMVQGHSRFTLGKSLVVAQIGLSLVLLVAAGLLLRSFNKLTTLNPGFDRDGIVLARVDLRGARQAPENRPALYRELLDRVRSVPGVTSASSSDITPVGDSMWNDEIRVDGFQPKSAKDSVVLFNQISDRYFETLGTPLLDGRDFNEHDTVQSPKVAIVNETFAARFFPGTRAIGRTYRVTGGPVPDPATEIIGIVKDTKYRNLREQPEPIAYVALSQESKLGPFFHLEVRSAVAPGQSVAALKAALAQLDPALSVTFVTLSAQLDSSLNRERILAVLSTFFGGLALLLATIGLYGVMAYSVERRRGEIGIRMALGAGKTKVLRMVLQEAAVLLVIGVLAGMAIAAATTRFVSTFLYGVDASDTATFTASAALLAAVTLIAGYLPARRAASQDPMSALREE